MTRARRWFTASTATLVMAAALIPDAGLAQAAGPRPTLKLVTADPSTTIVRQGRRAWLDAGVYVAAVGGAFELRIARSDYDHPVEVTQHVYGATGIQDIALPAEIFGSMVGLRRFVHVSITDPDGRVVLDRYHPFCPGSAVRVHDEGPQVPRYLGYCFGSPFALGTVWGIDDGWAMSATGYYGDPIKGPDGDYTVQISITDRYASLFQIAPTDASTTVQVTVVTERRGGGECPPPCEREPPQHLHRGLASGSRAVPTLPDPDPSVAPDLVALPAWSITVERRRRGDYLNFAATVWNSGPAPMVVEGFRRQGEGTMDAYQYFSDARGNVVGKTPAGDMMWDERRGHQHWHFMQFARFSLLNERQTKTVFSRKQAFCLAPTDAIDLLAPGADWNPGAIGLGGSNCGFGPSALWVREVLPTGWGDTYFQGLPGQSFDITDLPNGTYFIAVEANPLGLLFEGRSDNNVELREVILGGGPGNRTVRVPPWHGIDTEEGTDTGNGGGPVPVPRP